MCNEGDSLTIPTEPAQSPNPRSSPLGATGLSTAQETGAQPVLHTDATGKLYVGEAEATSKGPGPFVRGLGRYRTALTRAGSPLLVPPPLSQLR